MRAAGSPKPGHGARPVGLVDVGAAAGLSDCLAVGAEAVAELAGGDAFAYLTEFGREDLRE